LRDYLPRSILAAAILQTWSNRLDQDGVRQYLTDMTTRVSTKGQIILPAEFRQQDHIEPGQEFDVERIDAGEYRLIRRARRPKKGLVDLLLACPVKGFFVPIGSESTDTLLNAFDTP
jgi:AbrB family looped-hinge helix DNA binding protein